MVDSRGVLTTFFLLLILAHACVLYEYSMSLTLAAIFLSGPCSDAFIGEEQGCRIESVPLKRLLELSGFRKRRWEFRDGWLILEAF